MRAPGGMVYIIDDDDPFRESLERLVRAFGFAAQSFAAVKDFRVLEKFRRPGVLLLDIQMPDTNGLTFQNELVARHFPLPIVFITGHGDVPMSVAAIKKGAEDFVLKPFKPEQLLRVLKTALERDRGMARESLRLARVKRMFDTLTPKEVEVLRGVVAGQLNKQIASFMDISIKTVKIHRGRVMQKLGVGSVADLVRLVNESQVFSATSFV